MLRKQKSLAETSGPVQFKNSCKADDDDDNDNDDDDNDDFDDDNDDDARRLLWVSELLCS